MMMKDLTSNLPSTDELLRMLQGQPQHNRDLLPSIALFGAGLLVGAGLALLLAPTTGEELRGTLSDRLGSLREGVASNGEEHSAGEAAI